LAKRGRRKRRESEPQTPEQKALGALERIEGLLEKFILLQARFIGAQRTALRKWMRVSNNSIAAASIVVKSRERKGRRRSKKRKARSRRK
jgi:hypothetical protein